ncbi:MAG: ATP-dependent RNA helicase HrpA [Planctomycetota bacterium]|nr:ATP-dependent RNA helicase HrpA [Planctomycetota bacterium]
MSLLPDLLKDLIRQLEGVMPAERRELRARIGGLEKRFRDAGVADERALKAVDKAIRRSSEELSRRRMLVPPVTYPPELPVTAAIDALRDAVAANQVVIVAGETGSGKSTQLPKLCLELGRGVLGRIGHTQPRRIAARSIARRVAEELGVKPGGVVGVKVRFGDESGRDTLVKVLTDGMLLAETRSDARLDAYDTIIVDEAHERSLNIDFLLGYLRRLLPRRPDLKVILTSATIDVARLSAHFGGAPVVEIPGRTYPIDTRYRPPEGRDLDEEDPRILDAIARAVDEIDEAFAPNGILPDLLVFLSGEREIREAAEHLRGHAQARERGRPRTEILPLFARQTLEEQERIFAPGPLRRIVLATNVAETSLTVPRIHAVIDPGFARVLRYSAKSRVARLPVEEISQASARQRAGRAGRLGPGIAIRLYSEENFERRAEFTQPEILRTNLASVILQMEALNLGKAEDFPFVDPPSARLIADGRATLVELGASTVEGRLTQLGKSMSVLPLDPRLSRMLLASIDERSVNDILVVAAALAVQDPRIRPELKRDAADLVHARFADPSSDFAAYLRIWRAWRGETRFTEGEQQGKEFGSSQKRKWCEKNMLSYQRMREWSDVVGQLKELCAEHFSIKVGEPGAEIHDGAFHRAVLAGFASQVGLKTEKGEYRSSMGALFAVHPASALARRAPNWIVAAEVVETTRRFARICARIQPDWIARVAPHLCKKSQFEPHFVEETGQVAAWERTSFGELVLVPKRRVPFGPVDPVAARNVFIQEGLVAYRARTAGAFLAANRALREALEREEARGRRRGLLLEEEAAFAFYDGRVPKHIHSVPSFESWRQEAEERDPRALFMQEDDLLRDGAERVRDRDFPETLAVDDLALPLAYAHDPEDAGDGITARVPVEALGIVDPVPFEWMVPGLFAEKVEGLIRTLPKHLRVRLFPIEEVVQGSVEAIPFAKGSLKRALARHLSVIAQTEVSVGDFRDELLAPHLCMRFEVVDADGAVLAVGRDLAALAVRFAALSRDRLRASIDRSRDPVALLERDEMKSMPDEALPMRLAFTRAGIALVGYPALVREGPRVALRVLESAVRAEEEHRAAVAGFAAAEIREAVEHHVAYDPLCQELHALLGLRGVEDTVGFVARSVAAQAVSERDAPPRDGAAMLAAARGAERDLHDRVGRAVRTLHALLVAAEEVGERVRGVKPDGDGEPKARVAARIEEILGASLEPIARADHEELSQRLRLVQMLMARLERLREIGAARDRANDDELAPLRLRVAEACAMRGRSRAEILALRRMFEEIEISRCAPKLPRAFPASERRLETMLGAP